MAFPPPPGSGWNEYKKSGTVCSIPLPAGLQESERLPQAMFTPSTKAEVGQHGTLASGLNSSDVLTC